MLNRQQILLAGVLTEARHGPLLDAFDESVAIAGLKGKEKYLWSSAKQFIHSGLEEYFRNPAACGREQNMFGVLYGDDDAEDRLYALAGLFVRNYVDARVVTLSEALDEFMKERTSSGTVQLVPNFYDGSKVPEFRQSLMFEWLTHRLNAGQHTIVRAAKGYQQGLLPATFQHIQTFFIKVGA